MSQKFKTFLSFSVISSLSLLSCYKDQSLADNENKVLPKLKQIQVIFRHGARTPVFQCPKLDDIEMKLCAKINPPPGVSFDSPPDLPDVHFAQLHVTDIDRVKPRPFAVVDKFQTNIRMPGNECRLGQLTEKGALQASELGRELRERYSENFNLSAENIQARSTNVGRCLATLSAVIGSVLRNPGSKNHHVIPVATIETHDEYMTPNHSLCEILKVFFRRGRAQIAQEFSEGSDQNGARIKAHLEKLLAPEIITGSKLSENNFIRLHDWLIILDAHRDQLKEEDLRRHGLDTILDDTEFLVKMRKQAAKEVGILFGIHPESEKENYVLDSEAQKRLKFSIGLFLKELYDNLNSPENSKLFLFACHDTTIVPLLIALGIYDFDWPGYCSNITFETWDIGYTQSADSTAMSVSDLETQISSNNCPQYEVRILYNGVEKARMSLDKFNSTYKNLLPESEKQYKLDCGAVPQAERLKLAEAGAASTSF